MTALSEDGLGQARALAMRGETQRARQLYQTMLAREPGNQTARDELAALDHRSAQFQALTDLYRKGDLDEVLRQGQVLLRQYPDIAFLHNIIGNANAGLEKWDEARDCFIQALRIRPDIAETHVNLGKVLSPRGRYQDAIMCFTTAARIKPAYADAHYSLGVVLRDLKRHEEAIAAFARTIEIRSDFAEAHDGMGICLRHLERHEEAIACFHRALKLRPDFPTTHIQLGIALGKAGRYPASNAAFARALALNSGLSDTYAQKLYQEALICDWREREALKDTIATLGMEGHAVRPFVLFPLEDDPARHRIRAERLAGERLALPELAPIPRPASKPDRITIGYFSANFHDHAVMHMIARILELHDHGQFRVHAYSYGPTADDEMRKRAERAVDLFRDVRTLNDKEVAELARKDGVDIAIDLMGYTENARSEIFAYRAAPIQINYLGYPGTIGAPFMDYILADRMLIPEGAERHYSEEIIFLPASYMPSDDGREISARPITRAEMKLPEEGVVFCCFNNSYKLAPEEFGIWMRLLAAIEGSVLWLSGLNEWAKHNLGVEAEKRKIDPDRIIFAERLPMSEHLARHRLADLFLDTFRYNAHSTASDALWAGLPVITMAGSGFAARVAASLLQAAGLPELITHSPEEYEGLALSLARDPARLSALKAKLMASHTSAPLFDSRRFTRDLEQGYRQAYQRYFEGKAPATLTVSDCR